MIDYSIQNGFSPENDGTANRIALQELADKGGTIEIKLPGVYKLAGTVWLSSDTELSFGAGVVIQRDAAENGSYSFANRGALSRTVDSNITLRGLNISLNGIDVINHPIYGLNGIVSFFYVRNLRIFDFQCMDLMPGGFAIHICHFENIIVERCVIEGRKDGVHLGRGEGFVIRDCRFRTFDDPIALNAHDYATSNPELGWIENGLIENCYDLSDRDTTGYFCRILAGSWGDWFSGMEVQHSDTVVSCGRVYRVAMKPDGMKFISTTAPTHESGFCELDGIRWLMVQPDPVYSCGCKNVHFKDIYLLKRRGVAFSVHFDNDNWSRSYYPNTEAPIQDNLIFENIFLENEVNALIQSRTPMGSIKIINSTLGTSRIELGQLNTEGIVYPRASVLFSGVTFKGERGKIIGCSSARSASLCIAGSTYDHDDFTGVVSGDIRVLSSDINIERE